MTIDSNSFSADHNEYMPGPLSKAGSGLLRLVLLFGSAVAALTLIIVPVLNQQANKVAAQSVLPDGLDRMATGSISHEAPKASYIIRKSVLQKDPHSVCIIEPNGARHGDC